MDTQTNQKIDKRTKEYKDTTEPGSTTMMRIEALLQHGIPLSKVVFHDTVLSYGHNKSGEPENALYDHGSKPSRTAKLWYTPHGIVVKQKENYKIIPLAAIKDNDVLFK